MVAEELLLISVDGLPSVVAAVIFSDLCNANKILLYKLLPNLIGPNIRSEDQMAGFQSNCSNFRPAAEQGWVGRWNGGSGLWWFKKLNYVYNS